MGCNKKNKTKVPLSRRMQEGGLRGWTRVCRPRFFPLTLALFLFPFLFLFPSPRPFRPRRPRVVSLSSTLDPPYEQGLVAVVAGLRPVLVVVVPSSLSLSPRPRPVFVPSSSSCRRPLVLVLSSSPRPRPVVVVPSLSCHHRAILVLSSSCCPCPVVVMLSSSCHRRAILVVVPLVLSSFPRSLFLIVWSLSCSSSPVAPTIHPASSGSQRWGLVLGHFIVVDDH